MTASLAIDSVNLQTSYGFIIQSPLVLNPANAKTKTTPVFGRLMSYSSEPVLSPSVLAVSGTVVRDTASARETAEDAILALLYRETFTVTRVSWGGTTRTLANAALDGQPRVEPIHTRGSRLSFGILAPEASWRGSSTTVTIAAPDTDYALALGTAPSYPVITIPTANAAEVVTIKNGAGTAVVTLTFAALPAATSLVIDCVRGEIETVTGGVATRAMQYLASGDFPFALLPGWYNGVTPPTIRTSDNDGSIQYYPRYY